MVIAIQADFAGFRSRDDVDISIGSNWWNYSYTTTHLTKLEGTSPSLDVCVLSLDSVLSSWHIGVKGVEKEHTNKCEQSPPPLNKSQPLFIKGYVKLLFIFLIK